MIILKQMKSLLTFFLILLTLSSTQAVAKQYDVEVIIFEDAHAHYINSEDWRQQVSSFNESSNRASNYSSIRPYILTGSYKKLKASNNYNVLFYGGWRQTGLSKKRAFTLSLDQLKNRHSATSNNAITGDLKLVLARYLHVYGNLNYHRSDFSNPGITQNNFPINFHSRMRSKELHFIDHPLVGILIQVNPVKEKVAKTTPAQ